MYQFITVALKIWHSAHDPFILVVCNFLKFFNVTKNDFSLYYYSLEEECDRILCQTASILSLVTLPSTNPPTTNLMFMQLFFLHFLVPLQLPYLFVDWCKQSQTEQYKPRFFQSNCPAKILGHNIIFLQFEINQRVLRDVRVH